MIVLDHSASQQRRGTMINRYAYDQEEKLPVGISWEEYVNVPVVPRRSPWRTIGEDIEGINPTISDNKVAITPQNASIVPVTNTNQPVTSIDQSSLISSVTSQNVIAAIVNSLPVVEFECQP